MPSPVVPEIVAEITLLQSTEGGRKESIRQGEYRGVAGAGGEHFSFRAVVPFRDGFQPGHTARLGVQFLFPRAALEHFPVGGAFTLWEGGPIGFGKVLEVLPVTERRGVEGWH